jgi:hypothetical protein
MISGQKVVCINDRAHPATLLLYDNWIKKGTTYVVRDVFLGTMPGAANLHDTVAITLLGIYNPVPQLKGARERGFNSERFVPIEERTSRLNRQQPATVPERRELVPAL